MLKLYTEEECQENYRYGHGDVFWETEPLKSIAHSLSLAGTNSWVLCLYNDIFANDNIVNGVSLELTLVGTALSSVLDRWIPLTSSN